MSNTIEFLKEKLKRIDRLFLLTVLAPTLIAIIYFSLIASDVYVSESRFVVRSPEKQSASALGMLLKGAGFSRAQDDTYTVQDYMLSRDALQALEDKLALRDAFSKSSIDPFSRFSGIVFWRESFEALHQYYQKKLTLQFDPVSAITTMTVRAFSAEDAYRINLELLEQGEALVNRLNERGRQDLIRFAANEVAIAEEKAKAAAIALSAYRNKTNVIDPEKESAIRLQLIAKLQDELIATKAQLTQLQSFTRDNPQIPSLQKRAQNLQSEIDAEMARVAGGDKSLANKAAQFQRLALEREFADRQLGTALASLEQARNEAQRKQLYLERIVQPSLPDYPVEPKRILGIVATLVLGLIAWGVLVLLVAGVKEHRD
jgi:capsular polysaccharide transport system permease protein